MVSNSLAPYVWNVLPAGDDGVVNVTGGVVDRDTTYTWNVTVYGQNITAVRIGNVDAYLNATSGGTGNGDWIAYATPHAVANFELNCTYFPLLVNVTSKYGNFYYYHAITQQNLTMLPCVESGTQPQTASSSASDKLELVYSTGEAQSVIWMPIIEYNSTSTYCPYTASNSLTFYNNSKNTTEEWTYCVVTVNKSSSMDKQTIIRPDYSLEGAGGISYTQTVVGLIIVVGVGSGAYLLGRRKK